MPTFEELLSSNTGRRTLRDLLDNIEFEGSFNQSNQGNVNMMSGGGRLGYNQPLENGSFNVGVSGGGYKVKAKSPYGNYKDSNFAINGVDATYTNGANSFGVDYSDKQNFMLKYGRQF